MDEILWIEINVPITEHAVGCEPMWPQPAQEKKEINIVFYTITHHSK